MRRLIFLHSASMTAAEAALLREVQSERGWVTETFSEDGFIPGRLANLSGAEIDGALISGWTERPAQLARAVRRLHLDCFILFFGDATALPRVQRQLGVAPMLGSKWMLVRLDIAEIRDALRKAEETAGRQQRVRTTLQRMSDRIATLPSRAETRFQREMLSERYLVSVLSHGFDAVVCLGDRQQVIAWNAAAERLFQLSSTDALGRDLQELSTMGTFSTLLPALQAAYHGEPLQRFERRLATKDGSSCVLDMTIVLVSEGDALPGVVLIARDITDRRNAEEQVRREREWLQTTLGSIGDAVIATDQTGRVVFMNAVAEALTGWSSAEAQAQPLERIFVIVNEETRFPVESPVAKAIRSGTVVGLANHTLLISRTGEEHPIDDSAAPIRSADQTMQGVVLVFRDVTARRAAEREIIAAREEAERATKAKDRFLAVLSHELRTPLTPVVVLLDSLGARGELPGDVRSDLQLIRRNVMMEARLVDDLLDINRISQGKLQLQLELVDLHRTLEYAKDICYAEASEKSVQLISSFQATNRHVFGDLSRLQQVFWNLIQNAVKFTPKSGTIVIATKTTGDDRIEISVQDTGVGISADVLPKVFDAFEQGTTAVTRQFGGLGLGLAICRALVEAHDGSISASSRGKDQGATFTVRLKLATEDQRRTAPAAGSPASSTNQTARILLVEDHEDTRTTLRRLLVRRGHRVSAAGSIEEAISLASREQFDLLISDIGLPDGFGTDLMRNVSANHAGVKGIALSGFGLEEDIQASIRAGFSEHLTKPVNLQQLEDAIHRLLRREPGA